jgi:hypothetical protein
MLYTAAAELVHGLSTYALTLVKRWASKSNVWRGCRLSARGGTRVCQLMGGKAGG